MCVDDVSHVEGVLDSLLAITVEQHKFLLFARQGPEETRPETTSDSLVTGKYELLVLEDVFFEKHVNDVVLFQCVRFGCEEVLF